MMNWKRKKEVTWTFQLNGLERAGMKIGDAGNSLIADTDNCDVLARIFGSSELTASLVDTSYVKPFDWLNPQRGRKAIEFEKINITVNSRTSVNARI